MTKSTCSSYVLPILQPINYFHQDKKNEYRITHIQCKKVMNILVYVQ